MTILNVKYYLKTNPDVAAAVERGELTAEDHFSLYGRFENRSPSPFFDPILYASANPDVEAAVSAGGMSSLYDHFLIHGQTEGRDASYFFDPQVYLANNPDVVAAIEAGGFQSPWEHFLLHGQDEIRNTSQFFDLMGYLQENPDVAAAVQAGMTTAFDHFINYGYAEGRDLGNGISLSQFANDPQAQAAIQGGNLDILMQRIGEVAPFLPTYTPPAGYVIPSDQPIPQDFVPVAGEQLVIPEGVVVPPGTELPPAFEEPDTASPVPPELELLNPDDMFDTTPAFAGTAEAGAVVQIFMNGALLGSTIASLEGTFAFAPESAIPAGTHVFTAFATDDAGNRSDPSEEVSHNIGVESVRLVQPGGEAFYYLNLQDAVATAQEGATISVRAGAELEGDVTITARLHLEGEGAESIVAGGIRINAGAEGTVVEGLNIKGTLSGSTSEGATVFVLANDVTIRNNLISSDEEGAWTGLVVGVGRTGVQVIGNDVSGYEYYGVYANAVYTEGAPGTSVIGNTFANNGESLVVETGTEFIKDNVFDDNGSDLRISLRREGNFNLNDFLGENDYGAIRTVEARVTSGSTIIGTDGDDAIQIIYGGPLPSIIFGGAGNDVITGGAGQDTISGGSGANTLNSSPGNDIYVATARETIDFEFLGVAHSGFERDVTTFDFSAGVGAILLNILLSGEDFVGAASAIANDSNVAAFGIGRDSGPEHSTRGATDGFFRVAEGDVARITPGADPEFVIGAHSLVVYDRIGEDEFNVYFDANGNGNLDAGDGLVHIVGLGQAHVTWAASTIGSSIAT